MKNFQKIIMIGAMAFAMLVPHMVLAQTPTPKPTATPKAATTPKATVTPKSTTTVSTDTCAELKKKFDNSGGGNVVDELPKYCTIGGIYTKIVNTALYAIGIVAVMAVIYGGYMYMTAAGNAEQTKKGRSIITWAIIGLIVVIAAAALVNIVVNALVENRFV